MEKKSKKRKYLKKQIRFYYKNTKNPKMEIFSFCVIAFEPIKILTCSAPQNDWMIVWTSVLLKIKGSWQKTARNGNKVDFWQLQILGISLYYIESL